MSPANRRWLIDPQKKIYNSAPPKIKNHLFKRLGHIWLGTAILAQGPSKTLQIGQFSLLMLIKPLELAQMPISRCSGGTWFSVHFNICSILKFPMRPENSKPERCLVKRLKKWYFEPILRVGEELWAWIALPPMLYGCSPLWNDCSESEATLQKSIVIFRQKCHGLS